METSRRSRDVLWLKKRSFVISLRLCARDYQVLIAQDKIIHYFKVPSERGKKKPIGCWPTENFRKWVYMHTVL